MKYGMRTPSPRRSFKARTTAKWKRQAKKALIPGYGKKGMGWVRNPRKAAYNKVYRKTTFSLWDLLKQKRRIGPASAGPFLCPGVSEFSDAL